nr:hypothetical protein CFP56_03272 [Quercus suber]
MLTALTLYLGSDPVSSRVITSSPNMDASWAQWAPRLSITARPVYDRVTSNSIVVAAIAILDLSARLDQVFGTGITRVLCPFLLHGLAFHVGALSRLTLDEFPFLLTPTRVVDEPRLAHCQSPVAPYQFVVCRQDSMDAIYRGNADPNFMLGGVRLTIDEMLCLGF